MKYAMLYGAATGLLQVPFWQMTPGSIGKAYPEALSWTVLLDTAGPCGENLEPSSVGQARPLGLSSMEIEPYLDRIGYTGSREPTSATLRQLQLKHLLSVPFENLDILLGEPITCSLPSIYDKLVRRRRGGFCYEVNGLFAWLLERLGFSVEMLSARVVLDGSTSREFDHMLLLVGLEERWIADVGFGDSFLEPLRLDGDQESLQQDTTYRLTGPDSERLLARRREADWEPQFVFSLTPHQFSEFSPMCHWQQTSPESKFIRKSVCSRATPRGRVTLANGRLILTEEGRREDREVVDAGEYRALLSKHFGIELDDPAPVDRLMLAPIASNPR